MTGQIGHGTRQSVRHLRIHESLTGNIVFRVIGWLDGKRVRKNFPIRAEAEAESQVLTVQNLQGAAGIRTAVTRLTDEQLHEAEAVFLRLDGRPRLLSFYVESALAN